MNTFHTICQDTRFGLRILRKNPGFAIVAVFTLALGIGATSAVFALIQGVLLTPPPYPHPEQIVLITAAKTGGQSGAIGCGIEQWTEWRKEAKSFAAMAGYIWTFDYLVLPEGSKFFQGMEVTPDYFKVVGTKPLLGRVFLDSDASAKGDTVIVLGYDFWQRQFNGDPNVLGKSVKITRAQPPLAVVGVMPPGVRFLPAFSNADFPNYDINARVDYWIPVTPERSQYLDWNVAGRLREGVTLAQSQAELSAIAARQAQASKKLEGITARAQLLTAEWNRDGARLLVPLLGAVILVFLIACGNVAGLLLARGLQRQQEYAIRCALGAQRTRLFRQVFTESLVLSLLGGVLATFLAVGTVKVVKAIGGPAIPRLDAVTINWPVLACCLATAVLAAVFAGLLPALRASQQDPAQRIKGAGPTSSAPRLERRLLGGVAILQTAFTLALLVGAGLLIRTVWNLAKVRPGFDTQNILTMSVALPDGNRYDFHVRSLERVASLPGVQSAAYGWGLPLTGDQWVDLLNIDGQPPTDKLSELPAVAKRSVTPDYFNALGIPIVAGRGFRSSDNWENWKSVPEPAPGETPNVCIINQAMAKRYFPDSNPIGRTVRVGPWRKRPCEIVGVVADTRTASLTHSADPEIYISFLQGPVFSKHLVVRTVSDPGLLSGAVERELRAVDPTVAIDHIKAFNQIRAESVASQTFAMRLLVGFSLAGSLLALVGIYGVLTLSVGSRKREMAIRMAIGAQRRDVMGLVLSEGLKLISFGLLAGLVVALALGRLLRAILFGVDPADPMNFFGVAVFFTAVALLACYLPARRAMQTDPMTALRYE